MTTEEFRKLFPGLERTVYGKPLVYLDNAATTQRPRAVLDCLAEAAAAHNANIHRAVHALAGEATDLYEGARRKVAEYLGAEPEEIVFTSGTTAAINLVAQSLGAGWPEPKAGQKPATNQNHEPKAGQNPEPKANQNPGTSHSQHSNPGQNPEILIAESEHHSDIVPWQMLAQRIGATIKVLPVAEDGTLRTDLLGSLLTERTRIVCAAQISNVLGLENPIGEIAAAAHKAGALMLVDGAQGIAHRKPDLKDVDFYAFSAHKIYGPTGVGVLYARRELLEKMPPVQGGGEMIESVSWTGTTYAKPPHRFEAGTQNFNSVPAIVPALELLKEAPDTGEVFDIVYDALTSDPRIRLYGSVRELKIPLFSFTVQGAHHEDLALLLDKMGVAVRSGQMCAEPLMARYGVQGMVRASFAPYNTPAEAEYFVKCLHRAIDML